MDLAAAFDRLEDFCAVQRAQRGELTLDAVLLLQEAVGIEEEERRLLLERLPALTAEAQPGHVLLGILVGLFAAEQRS
jgi:hypothetical protein